MAAIAPQESLSSWPADAVGVVPQDFQPQQEAPIAQPLKSSTTLTESSWARHERIQLSARRVIGMTTMLILTIVISAVLLALSKGRTQEREEAGEDTGLPDSVAPAPWQPAWDHSDTTDTDSTDTDSTVNDSWTATPPSPSNFSVTVTTLAASTLPMGIESPRKLACIFTLGATTNDSYPEDGVCDFAIYSRLYYRSGGLLGYGIVPPSSRTGNSWNQASEPDALFKYQLEHTPGGLRQELRPGGGLLIFFQKSIEYNKTIFLAAFASETQSNVSNFKTAHFATHVKKIMGLSNIKGFGVIAEYYTADWFSDRRDNLVEFLEVLRMLLNGTDNPLVFFGAKLYGLPSVTESSKYMIALNDTLRKPVLFILVTHVGSNTVHAPEPTAAWSSKSFNNKDMPTLESALLFLKSLQPAPNVTVFLSLTLGVVQYKGADNSDNPFALGTTYRGRSVEHYREGCIEPGFVPNDYDPNEMVVFEVNTQQKVDRCYETVRSVADKVNRVLSEAGMVEAGWALFNAELEDNSNTNKCSGGHPTYPRIRAVRRVLDANAATFVPK